MSEPKDQSNKALRESVAELVKKSNHTYSGTPMHSMAGWGFMDVSSDIIALVTNHIKSKMPKPKGLDENHKGHFYMQDYGYNKALDEVSQILKEMGE